MGHYCPHRFIFFKEKATLVGIEKEFFLDIRGIYLLFVICFLNWKTPLLFSIFLIRVYSIASWAFYNLHAQNSKIKNKKDPIIVDKKKKKIVFFTHLFSLLAFFPLFFL